jgi:hypothetical protein
MLVNHKRVLRIMREDNLLAVQPRAVRGDHGCRSRVRGLSEPGQSHETDGDESALGSGHHLYPSAEGVCLPGRNSRPVFAESGELGVATVYALQDAAQAWKNIAGNQPGVHGTSPSGPGTARRRSHGKIVLRVA